jgi:hypothetical protein
MCDAAMWQAIGEHIVLPVAVAVVAAVLVWGLLK